MNKKKIFKKKNISWNIIFLLPSIIFIVSILLFFFYNKNQYFEINEFKGNFYKIPIDKGGQKISNLNKKSLHLKSSNLDFNTNDKSNFLGYSIQLFVSNDYNLVKNKLDEIFLNKKTIFLDQSDFNSNDFYILSFDTNIDIEFFLLYKNFSNKVTALEYCNNYLKFKNNCIILNIENLNS
tara:strand:+ start:244 stop:783 length:540 start_codon:yes stop_codon:yes gene_type:complete